MSEQQLLVVVNAFNSASKEYVSSPTIGVMGCCAARATDSPLSSSRCYSRFPCLRHFGLIRRKDFSSGDFFEKGRKKAAGVGVPHRHTNRTGYRITIPEGSVCAIENTGCDRPMFPSFDIYGPLRVIVVETYGRLLWHNSTKYTIYPITCHMFPHQACILLSLG